MQLSFRLDKRPGESHLALDGEKKAPIQCVHMHMRKLSPASQLWGRAGRLALADLREAALHRSGSFLVTSEARKALMVMLDRFTTGKPREIRASMPCKPHMLFTDGTLEHDKDGKPEATIGGVLVRRDEIIFCFGCVVPGSLMKAWQAGGRTHVIGRTHVMA